MRKQSHTLDKMFGKAELSVDIHHLLADDVSGQVNSPGISRLFSQLISGDEHLDLTHFVYPHYSICMSFAECMDYLTLSKMFGKAELSVDVHHP